MVENLQAGGTEVEAAELEATAGKKVALYTPGQIFSGTFFGGPLVAVHFLSANFKRLGKGLQARQTIGVGGILIVVFLFGLFFVPDDFPNYLIPLFYSGIAYMIASRYQLSRAMIVEGPVYRIYSNWRVAWLALLWMIIFLVIMLLFFFTFAPVFWPEDLAS